MLFTKIIRIISLLSITGFISYYTVFNENPTSNSLKPKETNNTAKLIEYRFNTKDGNVIIKAEKAKMQNLGIIDLINMMAVYKVKSKELSVNATNCRFLSKENKAYLANNVILKSEDLTVETESAIIDGKKQTIYGESKVIGYTQDAKFSASGFSVKSDGKIILKNAKIVKKP